jgi:hypothetical protein
MGLLFFTGRVDSWPLQGVAWFVGVGILGGVGNRYLNFFSMKELGLARTSIILQTSIIWSTGLAITLLGERLNLAIGAGTAAIMIGSILLVQKRESDLKKIPIAYYLVPVAAVFLQGFSHLLRKYGYAWIDSAPIGMIISSTVSVMTMIIIMPFTNEGMPKFWGGGGPCSSSGWGRCSTPWPPCSSGQPPRGGTSCNWSPSPGSRSS